MVSTFSNMPWLEYKSGWTLLGPGHPGVEYKVLDQAVYLRDLTDRGRRRIGPFCCKSIDPQMVALRSAAEIYKRRRGA